MTAAPAHVGDEPHQASHAGARLTIAALAIGVITALVAGLAIWDLRGDAITHSHEQLTNLSVVLAEQTARTIQAVDLVVQETRGMVLAAGVTTPDEFVRKMETEEIHKYLVNRLTSLPQANALTLIDASGRIVNFSRTWPVPIIDTADRDYYAHWRDHGEPNAFIGRPVQNKVTGAWVVTLTRRISGPHGEFLGIVLGVVEAQYFEEFYRTIVIKEGGSVSLFHRDGTLLARHPRIEQSIGKKISPESPWYASLAEGGSTFRTPGYIDEVARIVSLRPVREFPLVVAVGIAEDVAFAFWRNQSTLITIGALGAIVGFAVLFRTLGAQFRRLERQALELTRITQAVRDSESRFRDFALTSSDWFWEQDADLRFCQFSDESNKPDFHIEFHLGKTRWEIAHADPTTEHWDRHKADLAARWPFRDFRFERIGTDGKIHHLSVSGNPLFDSTGTFKGYRGTGTDVTPAVEAEARLRESEERFRQLFEAASDWFWETDAEHRRTYLSPNFETITGLSVAPYLGKRREEYGDTSHDPASWREHLATIEARLPFRDFVFQTTSGGKNIWLKVSGVPVFGADGAFRGYRGTGTLVTAQVEAEARRLELETQLHHSQRLEALGTLAGGVAHDLNNALVPVLAMTQLVSDGLPADGADRESLEIVLEGARRARALVQQILAFSRNDVPQPQEFDLTRVVSDGLRMLRASIPSTITLIDQTEPVLPITGDPGQLHQVLINLVTNAMQAIGDQPGTVTVTMHPSSDGTHIRLAVADTGCGMDQATKDRALEPFFTTKEVGKGTGLGLSIVYRIVSNHGGTIAIDSAPGKGTRFDIVLPVAAPRRARAA